jgi:hypothetical protein
MTRRSIAALKQKSGRSLQEWVDLGKKRGPKERAALMQWFKAEHGHGTNWAEELADRVLGLNTGWEDSPEQYLAQAAEYVDGMYAGGKAALRPLHDVLIELGLSMGNDVKVCPCSTIVPLYRNHVFAQIKPSTRTRIDFGLALGDTRGAGRLIETGGFAKKDRITHRVEITKPADIDGPVKKWLKAAYDRDAK